MNTALENHPLLRLREEPVNHDAKGMPFGAQVAPARVAELGWNLLEGDLPFPLMVIKESALDYNLRAMAAWCEKNNLLLAPHGKTTMSPQIFSRQLDHGAWAITVANVAQAQVCLSFGIERILIANQIAGASNLRSLAEAMTSCPDVELYCLVESVAGVRHLAEGLESYGARRPINVLIEWGRDGWRTGVRSVEQGTDVFDEALKNPEFLKVRGCEAFEGLASSPENPAEEARIVDEFLDGLDELSKRLMASWQDDDPPMISVGGSAFLDRVLHLARQVIADFRVVVRSGCYVTHDHGMYDRKQAAALSRSDDASRPPAFKPALELWSYVQSIPEPRRAFLTFGKRDCSYDSDLPIPLFALAEGEPLVSARRIAGAQVAKLNDQHAYLDLNGDEKLEVGDLICCGISHPCTAFDKWRVIPVVDDDYKVIDLYHTYF